MKHISSSGPKRHLTFVEHHPTFRNIWICCSNLTNSYAWRHLCHTSLFDRDALCGETKFSSRAEPTAVAISTNEQPAIHTKPANLLVLTHGQTNHGTGLRCKHGAALQNNGNLAHCNCKTSTTHCKTIGTPWHPNAPPHVTCYF